MDHLGNNQLWLVTAVDPAVARGSIKLRSQFLK